MKKMIMIMMMCLFVLCFLACSRQDEEIFEAEPDVINDADEIEEAFEPFHDPLADGTLLYQVKDCQIYDNITDAGIEKKDILEPHSIYASYELITKYSKVSALVYKNGSVQEDHVFVLVDFQIKNIDAIGRIKKKEFSVSNMSIWGGKPVSRYHVAYFSEAGKVDSIQTLHYNLEQGKVIDVQIGFFVLKEDTKNMVGVIESSENDVQFYLQ